MSVSFLDPETDIMDQFLGPETDIMGEGNFMAYPIISSYRVIPCETTEKKLNVPEIVSNFLGLLVNPNEE